MQASIKGDGGVHAVVEHVDLDLERSDISCIDGNASGLLFVIAFAKNVPPPNRLRLRYSLSVLNNIAAFVSKRGTISRETSGNLGATATGEREQ